ncbi:LOW QUALITY PROTEIN: hypothetical protein Cgig2_025965 [Carnegiea gigantea]|uniref:Reverse transcriptase n=1 Tax=Carnegiea gigantea TaxID=171969 RepID=A0A9Q1JZS2_9CARY|nr:LOW QUALITY PROTEIN: hypothetical protein Cgig2_025965 [Carnegiea gigantea]
MSIFKFPKDFCKSLQSIINRFWWGNDPRSRKIHWVRSSRLCDKKEDGGLAFCDFAASSDALLAKQLWRLVRDDRSLVARLLRAQYYSHGDVLQADLGFKPSFTWRSIWGVHEIVAKGARWLVGSGESIGVWTSRWILRPFSFRPSQPNNHVDIYATVAQLIDKENGGWREEMVREWFLTCDVDYILQIPHCEFTVKSAYHVVRSLKSLERPSRSGGCYKIWKSEKLYGGFKFHLESNSSAGRGALATKVNLAKRIPSLGMKCEICDALEESDIHVLFSGPLALDIWTGSDFGESLWRGALRRLWTTWSMHRPLLSWIS